MVKAIFPGSFDPLTRGHVDLVHRALVVFDKLVIGVLSNPGKAALFSVDERVKLIAEEFKNVSDAVSVKQFSGLLVEFARKEKAPIIIRGLRATSDYDYEAQMALINKHLWEELETFCLIAREENSYISSTVVKQVASLGGDVSKLVPPSVERALRKRFGAK